VTVTRPGPRLRHSLAVHDRLRGPALRRPGALTKMPARRASYETYRALPYPALIRGRFERGRNAMTDAGVPHDDMLSFLWRSGMDVPHKGKAAYDDEPEV